ncbi:MAG: tautomerase family protein [Alcaligenes sp.]
MPFITITTWPTLTDGQAQELIEAVTDSVASVTGAPLDKIAVIIHEVPKSRWGEGGTVGSNADFATLSRRQSK